MDPPHSASAPATSLRNLLELDRTLSPSDRKVLEVLLLRGSHLSARELSRGTGTNLQALYGALDRLEARGFVARERNGGSTQFRSAHPSVILHSLLEPGKRAAALAGEVEADLRRIYEGGDGAAAEPSERHATTTASPTAASSWLLDLIGGAVGEVWFLGDESPWFLPGASLEGEIASRGRLRKGVQVRMLVPPPTGGAPERPHLDRLERAGVDVRYSRQFIAPAVIVDRRWLLLRSGTSAGTGKGRPVYLRLDSPDLCRDLLSAGQDAWSRSGATGPRGLPGDKGGSPSPGTRAPAVPTTPAPTDRNGRPSRRRE
ncbi:MAG: hypothetical protein L3J81_02915 [Thermoplasmata archaeon]|jgi:predicted transcriptional regulator|nr:hypothetical protein [Thermoplasmata archaeon]